MAIDIFANNASATVSSGGTTAPASGTSESWTLSSIVGLAASTEVTQMRLIDPADSRPQPEIMLLTNLSGTTATVTRGVEGTTPVAHVAGFTVQAVSTAGSLAPAGLMFAIPRVFASGFWYTCASNGGNTSNGVAVNPGYANLVPFPVSSLMPVTFNGIAVRVDTAAAAGATARLGIYAADAAGKASALVLDAGTIPIDSTGLKSVTISQALNPALYYISVAVSANATFEQITAASGFAAFGYSNSNGFYQYYAMETTNITGSSALPASLSNVYGVGKCVAAQMGVA